MPETQPTLKTRLAHALFSDIIQQVTAEAVAAISVRVDDAPGWNRLAPAGEIFPVPLREKGPHPHSPTVPTAASAA